MLNKRPTTFLVDIGLPDGSYRRLYCSQLPFYYLVYHAFPSTSLGLTMPLILTFVQCQFRRLKVKASVKCLVTRTSLQWYPGTRQQKALSHAFPTSSSSVECSS